MYNGEFYQTLEIVIKSKTHRDCLNVAKKIKQLCDAWAFNVTLTEHKSARAGDVLSRSFLIYQTAYAHDIITFSESLRIIVFHYNLAFKDTSVTFSGRSVVPKDSRANLLN